MIQAILFDIDGVLTVDGVAVPGAPSAFNRVVSGGRPVRLLTNTTVRSAAQIAHRLERAGFDVDESMILTPAAAARRRLTLFGITKILLYAAPEIRADLPGIEFTAEPAGSGARVVLLGDLGRQFDYALLQEIFRELRDGAELWALHKSAYWLESGEIRLDLGPFVAALEFATGHPAVILGKPSPEAFLDAARQLGSPPAEIVMIGDDVRSDVAGAQAVGMRGVLVKTGKYREDLVSSSGVTPCATLDSVTDFPEWLVRLESEEAHLFAGVDPSVSS